MPESKDEKTEISTDAQLQACGIGLTLTHYAWTKLMAYTRAAKSEVSGFMLMERDGDLLYIEDIYLLEQECTSTSTEMDRNAIAKFQYKLYKDKVIGFEGCKKKLAHFHTHFDFGVFWSGTDMEMRHLNRQGVDYFVSLVVNQKGDALAAIDINGDFPMSINNLPIEILPPPIDAELIAACKAEVELKVKSPSYVYAGPREYHGYDGNYGGRGWNGLDGINTDTPDQLLLGPGDRRKMSKAERKARAKVEKLAAELRAKTGSIPWAEYKAQLEAVDKARTEALVKQSQSQYAPSEDDIRITGIEEAKELLTEEGDVWSDAGGTYQNIGGEVVKIENPMHFD